MLFSLISQVCCYCLVLTWLGKLVKFIFLHWMTASWLAYQFITSSFPVFSWSLSSVLSLTSPQSSLLWHHSSPYFARPSHSASFSYPRWDKVWRQKQRVRVLGCFEGLVLIVVILLAWILTYVILSPPILSMGTWCNISKAKDRVWPHFQTPRREFKKRHVVEYFGRTSRC